MREQDAQQEQDIDARLRAESLRLLARMDALLERARTILEDERISPTAAER